MSLTGRVTPTRGALIKLTANLELIRDGKNILKIKRDHLVGELNNLLKELGRRTEIENQFMDVYSEFKEVMATLGYAKVSSTAKSISELKTEVTPISIMGVIVPKISVVEKPQIDSIQDMGLYEVAENIGNLVDQLLFVAQIETRIERIAYELLRINRKVNALEKVIIPSAEKQIKLIQDLLIDEDLEEFSRNKHVRNLIGRKET